MDGGPDFTPSPCPHPEWVFVEALLGASAADGFLQCVICGTYAVDAGTEAD